ncbi:MAG: Holliday junction resolvase RuvX [Bacteroidia bacterium]|nr:Holliday junction resolvase RuvX [Bacteroidia bacterium]MCX7764682.1 Holliday junction resolvase RuvX [Bacteroidia bacterium]MDW8057761.1 Holliday junction resolvase RuvX [Bacteroidia bacterium]
MARILAIDYGLRRTGLAWTDPEQRVALPLAGVETNRLWEVLLSFLPEVEKIIVGYPRKMDGSPTDMTLPVKSFYEELRRRYPHISIELVDERLSTRAASYYMRQLPNRQRRDKTTADRLAATILLENYLLRKQI